VDAVGTRAGTEAAAGAAASRAWRSRAAARAGAAARAARPVRFVSDRTERPGGRSAWERLVPHWPWVLGGAAALAALLWLIFERTAS
jgi:hypothetical protein